MQPVLSRKQLLVYILMIAAPYLAVIIGLYIFQNAWLSIFLYHGQIIFWWLLNRRQSLLPVSNTSLELPESFKAILDKTIKVMLPISALAGFACYFLLPYFVRDLGGLELWLKTNQLEGLALVLLIPYFGILHPPIEQAHWRKLTSLNSPYAYISHICFAAYHGLVLYPILQNFWVFVCITILCSISFLWSYIREKKNGYILNGNTLAILSHVLADIGIVTATYLLLR